ncbi:MAG: M28 family peptidase [Bacteroidales bacterium]|nr:M28 family peptidase [Bacteroidales bacterium]
MAKKGLNAVAVRLMMAALALTAGMADAAAQRRDAMAMPVVEEDSIMKHIVELSGESYEGRLAGSLGYDRAVRYVERTLARYGVSVEEQLFNIECNEVENCKFNIYSPGTKEKRVFTLGNEFCCAGMTGRGYVDAQMVFCGYGSDYEEFNEYAKVDVQGKIVVLLTGVPEGSWLPYQEAERIAQLRDKARVAEKHGALGLLAINMSPSCLPYEVQGRVYCGELPHLATFPILQLTLDCGRELFYGEAMSLDSAVSAIGRDKAPHSFALLKKAEVDVNAIYRQRAVTANVIGLMEGTDRRFNDELIVVGASLDHAGMQGGTCFFPGADINASGVAAVLETARLLSQPQFRPRRSVLFVLFSGSEQRFLGSRVFLSNYPKLRKVEAFVNLQNIGSGDSIALLGDNRYPSLWEIARERDSANHSLIWANPEKTNPVGDARGFDMLGIPSLVFTSLNGMQHNHVTSDIWEDIDRRMLTGAAQVAVETVRELCDGLYRGRSPKSKAMKFVEN